MIDVTLQNFEADVLQASTRAPVLLDVWAESAGLDYLILATEDGQIIAARDK